MARKKIIFGNWKMNNTIAQAKDFCAEAKVISDLAKEKDIIVGVAPSYLALQYVVEHKENLLVFAEEAHYADHGAFTGNVSIPMLQEIGVQGSLVGHSERRKYHGETDLVCNRKIKVLVKANMGVMYCCGETLKEFDEGLAKDVIRAQVNVALMGLKEEDLDKVYIAYEPVWSIGTGKNASEEIATEMCSYIRSIVRELFSDKAADKIMVLYGGSVKPHNIKGYLSSEEVDGALVGGASLTASSFEELIKNI
ncbi:MAG: triose-phosphate isomerase [Bacilli bacterium]